MTTTDEIVTATETTTSQKLARLANLRSQGGRLAFERVTLAKEIIEDKAWLTTHFMDDEFAAADMLMTTYLGDLCGAINFFRLMKIREHFKTVEEWESYKFNLTAMSAAVEVTDKKPKEKRTTNRVTLKEYEELLGQKVHFEAKCKHLQEQLETAERRIQTLSAELQNALQKNAHHEGRIAQLELQLSSRRTA